MTTEIGAGHGWKLADEQHHDAILVVANEAVDGIVVGGVLDADGADRYDLLLHHGPDNADGRVSWQVLDAFDRLDTITDEHLKWVALGALAQARAMTSFRDATDRDGTEE